MEYETELNKQGEKTIAQEVFYYENTEYKVLVTKDTKPDSNNELYYNIYVTNEYMKEEPLNNLALQEPQEAIKEEDFNKEYCELRAIEFYLWFKYSTNEKVKSFGVEEY